MSHLNTIDVIHECKDPEYRISLSEAERAILPAHSDGLRELTAAELGAAAGGDGCNNERRLPTPDLGSFDFSQYDNIGSDRSGNPYYDEERLMCVNPYNEETQMCESGS